MNATKTCTKKCNKGRITSDRPGEWTFTCSVEGCDESVTVKQGGDTENWQKRRGLWRCPKHAVND